MNWKTIIKEDAISKKNRDRRERASSIAGKGKSPVKLVGASDDKDKFGRIRDNDEEDSFADNDEYEEEFLADMTRYDLMNKVRELPPFNVEPIGNVDPKKGESALGADVQFRKLRRRSEAAKAKILDTGSFPDGFAPPQGKGYLRNLLINAQIVQEEMGNASTLEDGLMNLMKRISTACGGIWDLGYFLV